MRDHAVVLDCAKFELAPNALDALCTAGKGARFAELEQAEWPFQCVRRQIGVPTGIRTPVFTVKG